VNKECAKGFVAGVLLMAMLSATLAFASSGITREIYYGISVVLNGHPVQFDEDSRPFIMEDRTFLPLRTMAELLGLPVHFDAKTNTAYVGHGDIAYLLLGAWIEQCYWNTWPFYHEFFADGTGSVAHFDIDTGEKFGNDFFFAWSVDGDYVYLFDEYGNVDYRVTLYWNAFGDIERLVLTAMHGRKIDGIVLERLND